MGTAPEVYFTRGVPWTASPEAIGGELRRVCSVPFFEQEEHWLENEQLRVVGVLSRRKKYGGTEELRVRLAYPDNFPEREPSVFDHDRVFEPCREGHQFEDSRLCLTFPPRKEFMYDQEFLSLEVLGAAWNWMVKRYIFERSGRTKWPDQAEPHEVAAAFEALLRERASQSGNVFLGLWVEVALRHLFMPNFAGMCPCLSGRLVRECHTELAQLLAATITVKSGGVPR